MYTPKAWVPLEASETRLGNGDSSDVTQTINPGPELPRRFFKKVSAFITDR
jgi:hypothetical protein